MDTLNLGALEKGKVEAAMAAGPVVPTPEPPAPPAPKEPKPIVVDDNVGAAVHDPAEPLQVNEPPKVNVEEEDEVPVLTPEQIEAAAAKIDNIIDDAEEDDKVTDPEIAPSTDAQVYSTLSTYLKEKGLLPDDIDVKDEDSFIEAFKKTIEKEKFAGLTDKQKDYLEAVEAGVKPTEAQQLVTVIDQLSKLDARNFEANENLSISLVTEDLKAQGWTDERIAKHIDRLKTTNELALEGLAAKDNILANRQDKLQKIKDDAIAAEDSRVQKEREDVEALKTAIFEEKQAFKTVKVDDSLRNKVYEMMTTPVAHQGKTPINALMKDRMDNPVDFEKRLYYAYTLTNGFTDMSRLTRRAESSAARKLKDVVQNLSVGMESGGTTVHQQPGEISVPNIVNLD